MQSGIADATIDNMMQPGVSLLQLSHRSVCGTSLDLKTKVVIVNDLRVAPRPLFQIIPLTVMVMSLSGELLWSVLDLVMVETTLLTFKSGGGGVEEDREQLGSMTLLVVTVFNQLIHVVEVEFWKLCQRRDKLRCVLGMLLDSMSSVGETMMVWSCSVTTILLEDVSLHGLPQVLLAQYQPVSE